MRPNKIETEAFRIYEEIRIYEQLRIYDEQPLISSHKKFFLSAELGLKTR